MRNTSHLTWLEGMAFKAEQFGHEIIIDGDSKFGGKDLGTRPKVLLLTALAGCTGMDVVSILKKMKVENFKLEIRVDGELTEQHPKIYHTINVNYEFTGVNIPAEKVKKAIELSETKYCGVSAMLNKAAQINSKIKITQGEIS